MVGRIALITAATAACALAQPRTKLDQVLDDLAATRHIREVAISPDAKTVAWVESVSLSDARAVIYIRDPAKSDAAPRRVSAGDGDCIEQSLAWAPDSSRLAFLSDCGHAGQPQIAIWKWKGKARQITNAEGQMSRLTWSPDARSLAFLYIEGSTRRAGPTEAVAALAGVAEEHPEVQRLTLADPSSGELRSLTPPALFVYEYDWSPDSSRVGFTAAPPPGDNNWYVARIYSQDVGSSQPRVVAEPPMQMAVPRWTPDGKAIAFIGGLMSDEGVTGGDVWLAPVSGGAPRNMTPGQHASTAWMRWLRDGSLLATELRPASVAITRFDPKTGRSETLWEGAETITAGISEWSISVAADERTFALVRSSWKLAPELWAGPLDALRKVTNLNREARPSWGDARRLGWSSDKFTVNGWLIEPANYDPKQKYPLIVDVHGGPASERMPFWPRPFFDPTVFSALGYFVLMPNPRGSYGQGEEFTRANVKDFGYGDFRDILAGVDEVVKRYPVDHRRIGLAGWSYGGFMTMWGVTQTDRFHAAVAGAGLANWQSYYGENSIDEWMIPYFGASVYDDPAVYARSSPINFVKRVKTPTLVLVGERDGECPLPQSQEFWHALKTIGAKTQLVVYPGEGHVFRNADHIHDVMRRTAAWFEENLR